MAKIKRLEKVPEPVIHFDEMRGSNTGLRRSFEHMRESYPPEVYDEALRDQWHLGRGGLWQLEAMLRYAQYGENSFVLGPTMQHLFHCTRLQNIKDLTDLMLPFPCFYVALPGSSFKIWGGDRTQWHPVTGFYVVERGPWHWNIVVWGDGNERSEFAGDDANFWFELDLANFEDSGYGNLEDYLQAMLNNPTNDASDIRVSEEVQIEMAVTARGVLRLAVNLMLYMICDSVEKREEQSHWERRKALEQRLRFVPYRKEKQRVRIEDQIARLSTARVVWLGESEEASGLCRGGQTFLRSSPGSHWVRGHWRWQAHGPQMSLRKLKWIKTYHKEGSGKECKQGPGRIYKLRGDRV